MTDQKQAPERYSPAVLFSTQNAPGMRKAPHGEFVTYVAYAALAKQRDELYAEMQVWKLRCVKAEAERDELEKFVKQYRRKLGIQIK